MTYSVLLKGFRTSENYFLSDTWLKKIFKIIFSQEEYLKLEPLWNSIGARAALDMNEWAREADRHGPVLVQRNWYGEDIQQIKFHPAYDNLLKIAIESGMFRIKWNPEVRKFYVGKRHSAGFSIGFFYAMSENGLYCPLCMTDGAALLIEKYGDEGDKKRLLPRIYTQNVEEFKTGAMFLTEKSGGSDVGNNQTVARRMYDNWYKLNGEKWFCSNANADMIFVLARTNSDIPGTKGLSIFLVEPFLPDGSKNPLQMVRLKDKLGVRSMASAEIILTDTIGKIYGSEGEGFKIMSDMINLSRLYNAVTAVADVRRAIIETWQFLEFRMAFGKPVNAHSLMRKKWLELIYHYLGDLALLWRAIQAYDRAELGDANEAALIRLITPMIKKCTARNAVYMIRETMELMGGMGYIEDGILPRLYRDALVLPIWEGTGNIMTLDMKRVLIKQPEVKSVICHLPEFKSSVKISTLFDETDAILSRQDSECELEDLLFKIEMELKKVLLQKYFENEALVQKLIDTQNSRDFNHEEVKNLIGWEF